MYLHSVLSVLTEDKFNVMNCADDMLYGLIIECVVMNCTADLSCVLNSQRLRRKAQWPLFTNAKQEL